MKKKLKQIEDEINQIHYYYDTCKMQYGEWDLGDKIRFGQLYKMKERRLAEHQHKELANG